MDDETPLTRGAPEIPVDARGAFEMPSDAAPFRDRVLAWVALVPHGRVATYGQIAALVGAPRAARQVGAVLRGSIPTAPDGAADPATGTRPEPGLPWHRIINAKGGISTDKLGFGDLQRALLRAEGVAFDAEGRCSLRRFRWDPGRPGGPDPNGSDASDE